MMVFEHPLRSNYFGHGTRPANPVDFEDVSACPGELESPLGNCLGVLAVADQRMRIFLVGSRTEMAHDNPPAFAAAVERPHGDQRLSAPNRDDPESAAELFNLLPGNLNICKVL